MAFRRNNTSIPDGYRRAKDNERADMTLNGEKFIRSGTPSSAYSDDDGLFDNGNVGDRHYENLFNRDRAADNLRNAEKDANEAKSDQKSRTGTQQNQRDAEEGIQDNKSQTNESQFQNNVSGKNQADSQSGKGKGFLKKGGPIIAIICAMLGIGGGMIGSQGLMCISLVENIGDKFDSIGVSQNSRSSGFLKSQLGQFKKNTVHYRIFGEAHFKISDRQTAKLGRVGIDVDEINGIKVLKFQGKTIAPSQEIAEQLGDAIDFDSAFELNTDFRHAYIDGSATWRTAVAAWYDKTTTKLLDMIGVKRNHGWPDQKSSSDPDIDSGGIKDSQQAIADTINKDVGDTDIDGKGQATEHDMGDVDPDEDNTELDFLPDGDNTSGTQKGNTSEELKLSKTDVDVDTGDTSSLSTKLQNFANTKVAKVSQAATQAASTICTVMDVIGAIGLIVAASEMAQVIQLASSYLEGIQKGKIDDSVNAPINDLGNTLAMSSKEKILNDDKEYIEVEGSAMSSESIRSIYSGTPANGDDPSVKSFNVWANVNRGITALGLSATSYSACLFAKEAAATVDLVMDFVQVAACFVPPFVQCAVSFLVEAGVSAAISLGISAAISAIIGLIVPAIANMLIRDLVSNLAGESLGNAIVNGASAYIGQNSKAGGQGAADKKSYLAYLNEQDTYMAQKSRYEQETHSPFDTSSQYTFMGTLLLSLSPLATSRSGILSKLKDAGSVISSSVNKIIPGAKAAENAINTETIVERTTQNCAFVDGVGALADEYCNPIIITDVHTLDMENHHPSTIIDKIDTLDDFEGVANGQIEDQPTIKKNSKLAKYILFCGQRESTLGVADQNIAGQISSGNIGTDIAGALPFAGSITDMVTTGKLLADVGFITGESCVINNESATASWGDRGQYYSRFVEDQRLAENMGYIEKSSVTAFLEEWYEENPLDNSFEGILSRKTGLTKENVTLALESIQYFTFLADYEPADYYPTPAINDESDNIQFENQNNTFLAEYVFLVKQNYLNEPKRNQQYISA